MDEIDAIRGDRDYWKERAQTYLYDQELYRKECDALRRQLEVAKEALGHYANQDNWRPLLNQELGEHKLYIYSGCTPNILYAGMDAFNALSEIEKIGGSK